MSSMFLLKEHNGKRRGDVVSVPFGEGKRMIADGVACYWNGGADLPALPPVTIANVVDHQHRRKRHTAETERPSGSDQGQEPK